MMRLFVGFILSLLLPPTYTGRKYFTEALRQRGLTMPDKLIHEIVAKCIPDAKEKAKLARLAGAYNLASWRANFVRELDSVVLAMISSRNGKPLDPYFHPTSVNEILMSHGLVVPPRKPKVTLAAKICCDKGHMNGFFKQEIEEGRDITRASLELIADSCSDDDSSYCCCLCGAPVAIRIKNIDKWVVRAENDWVA